jgi:hypothetical protein
MCSFSQTADLGSQPYTVDLSVKRWAIAYLWGLNTLRQLPNRPGHDLEFSFSLDLFAGERVRFFVGITDRDWFDFLSRLNGLDEVNFWQPSGQQQFRALQIGEPFLFKLHSPTITSSAVDSSATSRSCPPALFGRHLEKRTGHELKGRCGRGSPDIDEPRIRVLRTTTRSAAFSWSPRFSLIEPIGFHCQIGNGRSSGVGATIRKVTGRKFGTESNR